VYVCVCVNGINVTLTSRFWTYIWTLGMLGFGHFKILAAKFLTNVTTAVEQNCPGNLTGPAFPTTIGADGKMGAWRWRINFLTGPAFSATIGADGKMGAWRWRIISVRCVMSEE